MKGGEEQRGGRPLPADEVLILLTDVLLRYLEQLKDARAAGENSFLYGEQTACCVVFSMMTISASVFYIPL